MSKTDAVQRLVDDVEGLLDVLRDDEDLTARLAVTRRVLDDVKRAIEEGASDGEG